MQNSNLKLSLLLYVLLAIFLLLIFYIPKIYLRNEIYYISRDIFKKQKELDILKEENKDLKLNIQKKKFENLVEDNIFYK